MCKKQERIPWLDELRGIAMFLVIAGHIITLCVDGGCDSWICGAIYHVHIPLFLFISGLLAKDRNLDKKFWTDIIKRFVIPYVIWNTAVTLWYLGIKKNVNGGILFTLHHIIDDRWMWFIPTFLSVYIGWQLLKPLTEWKRTIVGVIGIYAFQGLSITFWCFVWYGLAASVRTLLPRMGLKTKLLCLTIVVICFPFVNFKDSYIMFLMHSQYISSVDWNAIFMQFFIGIPFCLLLITSKPINVQLGGAFLQQVGHYTLPMYMLQTLLVEAALPRILHLKEGYLSYCIVFVVAVCMTYICFKIIRITSKYKLLGMVLWGNKYIEKT